jgi:hypothetical protein
MIPLPPQDQSLLFVLEVAQLTEQDKVNRLYRAHHPERPSQRRWFVAFDVDLHNTSCAYFVEFPGRDPALNYLDQDTLPRWARVKAR